MEPNPRTGASQIPRPKIANATASGLKSNRSGSPWNQTTYLAHIAHSIRPPTMKIHPPMSRFLLSAEIIQIRSHFMTRYNRAGMLLSAEIRLFWSDHKPADLEAWFMDVSIHGSPPDGPEKRTDIYLADPKQTELGVKTRGEKPGVEVKGLIATPGDTLEFASYEMPVELWSKWSSESLAFDKKSGIELHKTRWLRRFDIASGQGCNIEWTIVRTRNGATCWTLGFEAFGPLQIIQQTLRSTVRLMNGRTPPPAPGAVALSYPAWLATQPSL